MIGQRLQYFRKSLNMTVDELSQNVEVKSRTIGGYERGEREPSIEYMNKLINLYSLNTNWLINGSGSMLLKANNSLTKVNNYRAVENFKKCGHRIIQIQEKNDLTNKEMAKIMGVSEGTYMKICAGNDTPNEKELNKLKENFDIDMDWLMYGDTDAQPNNINNRQNQTLPPLTPDQYKKLLNLLNNQ